MKEPLFLFLTAEVGNRTEHENVVTPGGGDFDGTFDMLLTFDLVKIKLLFGRTNWRKDGSYAEFDVAPRSHVRPHP